MSPAPQSLHSATLTTVPAQVSWQDGGWTDILRDGTRVLILPIRASEAELERRFLGLLSPGSRRVRCFETFRTTSDAGPRQPNVIDPSTGVAYLAVIRGHVAEREIGVARFSAGAGGDDCEFDVSVTVEWHRKGLGMLLMKHLLEAAQTCGVAAMRSNHATGHDWTRGFTEPMHFQLERDAGDMVYPLHSLDLGRAAPTASDC